MLTLLFWLEIFKFHKQASVNLSGNLQTRPLFNQTQNHNINISKTKIKPIEQKLPEASEARAETVQDHLPATPDVGTIHPTKPQDLNSGTIIL